MSDRPLRVLICRPDHLGDLLLTLAALPHHDPAEVQVGIACSPPLTSIAARCPAVDHVVPIPFSDPAHPQSADIDGALDAAANHLRGNWDIALLPRSDDPQSGRLAATAGIPRRIGYAHPATRPWLTETHMVPDGHVSELTSRLLEAALPDHVQVEVGTPPTPCLIPTPGDVRQADEVLTAHRLDAARLVLLHPGAGWPLKRWPAQHWAQVGAWLLQRGLQVALTGVANERPLHDAIINACEPQHAQQLVSLAGALDLPGMVGLLARTRLLVAIDSGPLHLAAALGTPVVGLYGPFSPHLFGPPGDPTHQRVLTLHLPCQPCNTLETPPCGATTLPACLTALTPGSVTAAIAELLGVCDL